MKTTLATHLLLDTWLQADLETLAMAPDLPTEFLALGVLTKVLCPKFRYPSVSHWTLPGLSTSGNI